MLGSDLGVVNADPWRSGLVGCLHLLLQPTVTALEQAGDVRQLAVPRLIVVLEASETRQR